MPTIAVPLTVGFREADDGFGTGVDLGIAVSRLDVLTIRSIPSGAKPGDWSPGTWGLSQRVPLQFAPKYLPQAAGPLGLWDRACPHPPHLLFEATGGSGGGETKWVHHLAMDSPKPN